MLQLPQIHDVLSRVFDEYVRWLNQQKPKARQRFKRRQRRHLGEHFCDRFTLLSLIEYLTPCGTSHDYYQTGDSSKLILTVYETGHNPENVKIHFEPRSVSSNFVVVFVKVLTRGVARAVVLREW